MLTGGAANKGGVMSIKDASADDIVPAKAGNLWRTEIALRVRELRHRLEAVCATEREGGDGERDGGEEVIAVAARVGAEGVGMAVGTTSAAHEPPQLDGDRRAC